MDYPRVMLIGNECISNTSSNGRTMRNLFVGWPKERIAQFCIRNTEPDYNVCNQFYYVSDQDALNSFLKGTRSSGIMVEPQQHAVQSVGGRGRNPLTMLIRDVVWNSMRWAGTPFVKWVEDFAPDIILLQAGDCACMLNVARKLAKKYAIPLLIYNSEAYYFKRFDYFRTKGIKKFFYPIFHAQFRRSFRKCIHAAKYTIYCCDKLKEDYDKEFGIPSDVIYTTTHITPAHNHRNDQLQIVYLGNLGVGRHEGLVEIGNTLQRISANLKLKVYGKIPNDEVRIAFENCAGIEFKGFVSYDQVVEILHTCDILIHTENFSEFYKEDLKYAFSTKIADSLASGTCFVIYAPDGMACTDYLKKNQAAWVINSSEKLLPTLEELCYDYHKREIFLEKAIDLSKKNHNPKVNAARFQELLCDCLRDGLYEYTT